MGCMNRRAFGLYIALKEEVPGTFRRTFDIPLFCE